MFWIDDSRCCLESDPFESAIDAAISELNGRENLLWANAKTSGQQFLTDAEIDAEILKGKFDGRLYTDLGPYYGWPVSPTSAGGAISFKNSKGIALYRTPATLRWSASWSRAPLPLIAGQYMCTSVASGDGITFIREGSKRGIKLIGIDAPESSYHKDQPGQPLSEESADYLAEMVLNKEVKIVLYGTEGDPSGTGEEHRSLGVVYVDGKNVNLEMLKVGLAQVDLKHPFPGFDLNPYLETEKEARDADLGIWSLGDCHVNPWDWITEEYARQKALACE